MCLWCLLPASSHEGENHGFAVNLAISATSATPDGLQDTIQTTSTPPWFYDDHVAGSRWTRKSPPGHSRSSPEYTTAVDSFQVINRTGLQCSGCAASAFKHRWPGTASRRSAETQPAVAYQTDGAVALGLLEGSPLLLSSTSWKTPLSSRAHDDTTALRRRHAPAGDTVTAQLGGRIPDFPEATTR